MDWLSQIERENEKIEVYSELFVFDGKAEAKIYADRLSAIENDPSVFDIHQREKWDRDGILSILLTYKRRSRSNGE